MVYVFDSGPLIDMFRHYYPGRFPGLWEQFTELMEDGNVTSTREVMNELEGAGDPLSKWCSDHRSLFAIPGPDELVVVRRIFAVDHFQTMIRSKERLAGRPVADPFVISRASVLSDSCVVTTERSKPNAARIPNICEYFRVAWTDLRGFMEMEDWVFW